MRPSILLPTICATLVAGCATQESRESTYDKALAQWQGATEDTLRARWGKPFAEEQNGNAKWLTYVVASTPAAAPSVSFSIGGFGFGGGGHTAVGGGVGVTAPLGQPAANTCTTRFLVENGRVSSWNFEGPGCGAT